MQARHDVAWGMHTLDSANITVADAAQLWLARGTREELERSTLRQYRNHVRLHISPLIGAVRLSRLSTPLVGEFRDDLIERRGRTMAQGAGEPQEQYQRSAAPGLGGAERRFAGSRRHQEARKGQALRRLRNPHPGRIGRSRGDGPIVEAARDPAHKCKSVSTWRICGVSMPSLRNWA